MAQRLLWTCLVCLLIISCTATRNYNPAKKYSSALLKEDYSQLRNALETKHPSLYWYTSKDSIDRYFSYFETMIRDSMTEQQFTWQVLAPLVDKIHCGHTTVNMSKAYRKWANGKKLPSFPLFLKVWNDTMAVTGTLTRKDSLFKRGTIIHKINGLDANGLTQRMFNFLPEDGYANTLNYIRISSNFPYFHRNIFGLHKTYKVEYSDSSGSTKIVDVPMYMPPEDSVKKDSAKKTVKAPKIKIPERKRAEMYRSLKIDSAGYAVLTLNSFTKGNLRTFFRRSFRELEKKNITDLVLDIRSNSGGRIGLSTLLTKYISRKPFRVADSVYARSKTVSPFTSSFEGKCLNNLQLFIIARKQKDGLYHLPHLEKKIYRPKKKRYKGNVYVLTSGPTFSAASLFCNAVKGQEGIILAGEETGGGWHGNNGIMIPEFTLKNTRTVVTFPLFRLVQYNHVPKNGSGVVPDLYIGTSYEALVKGYDKKMQVVRDLILARKKQTGL